MKVFIKRITHRLLGLVFLFFAIPTLASQPASVTVIARGSILVGVKDGYAKASFFIQNLSKTPVKNIDYALIVGGKEIETAHCDLATPLLERKDTIIEVPVPPATHSSKDEVTLHIKLANGLPNTYDYPYTSFTRCTISKVEKKKVVMEDYTAMWCRYCPRAMAAIDHLVKKYPNDFIGIVVHDRDQLACSDYYRLNLENMGRPSVVVNRSFTDKIIIATDKNLSNRLVAEKNFKAEQAKGSEAVVNVEAVWNKDKTGIEVNATTTFRMNQDKSTYALAYVVLASGLTKREWYQYNSYAYDQDYKGIIPEMDNFVNGTLYVYNLTFDNTAIKAAGINNGLEGSIASPIVEDEPQKHQYTFESLGENAWLVNKDKVQVCALLIDTTTKKIVNADRVDVKTSVDTGIETPQSASKEIYAVARYNEQGMLIVAPTKGINIVKYSDGSLQKEIVR